MIIQCYHLSKSYKLGRETAIEVLTDVSLSIKEGEFVALMGPSGSGKSTLMHLLGLLDTPTSGTVLFKDKDVSKLTDNERAIFRNAQIGFVFQQFFLLSGVSVLENTMLPLLYSKKKSALDKDRAIELLRRVGLNERLRHVPNQLSGGQQQRVAIARALINNPSIIFADEPTGNLDTKTGEGIMKIFMSLNKEGKTIVMVTHEASIAKHATRIISIRDGKIWKR